MTTSGETKDPIADALAAARKDLKPEVVQELRDLSTALFQPDARPPAPSQLAAIENEIRQNLMQASYHYQTARWIPDRRHPWGRPLLKKFIFRVLSFYTDRQTHFNATVVRVLNGLHEKLAFAFQRADRQEQEIRELRAMVEALSDQKKLED